MKTWLLAACEISISLLSSCQVRRSRPTGLIKPCPSLIRYDTSCLVIVFLASVLTQVIYWHLTNVLHVMWLNCLFPQPSIVISLRQNLDNLDLPTVKFLLAFISCNSVIAYLHTHTALLSHQTFHGSLFTTVCTFYTNFALCTFNSQQIKKSFKRSN